MEIRRFAEDVAEGAAELFRVAQPGVLTTAEYLIHRERTLPERARRLALVAVDGGAVVGWGSAMRRWYGGSLDEAAIWVMVKPSHRRRGLGAQLLERAERHAIDAGATTLRTFAENDPAGAGFLGACGYTERGAGIVSALEPSPVEVPARAGVEVATLSELAREEELLFEFWSAAGAFSPASTWGVPAFDEWRPSRIRCLNPMRHSLRLRTVVQSRLRGCSSTVSAVAPRTNGRRRCLSSAVRGWRGSQSCTRFAGPRRAACARS